MPGEKVLKTEDENRQERATQDNPKGGYGISLWQHVTRNGRLDRKLKGKYLKYKKYKWTDHT